MVRYNLELFNEVCNMAMVICPECGREWSQYAESCLKCGFPIIYVH